MRCKRKECATVYNSSFDNQIKETQDKKGILDLKTKLYY
jgi:hypothetical protein